MAKMTSNWSKVIENNRIIVGILLTLNQHRKLTGKDKVFSISITEGDSATQCREFAKVAKQTEASIFDNATIFCYFNDFSSLWMAPFSPQYDQVTPKTGENVGTIENNATEMSAASQSEW